MQNLWSASLQTYNYQGNKFVTLQLLKTLNNYTSDGELNNPRGRLFEMVQRDRRASRLGSTLGCKMMHGDKALWLCDMGEHARRVGPFF